jgi:hypothetical protein
MAAQSRHGSPSKSSLAHNEGDAKPEVTQYELERNNRKKELHDRIQSALVESGFGEAVVLREKLTGECSRKTSTLETSKRIRRRRLHVLQSGVELPRRSARTLSKEVAAPQPTSTTQTRETQVYFRVHSNVYRRTCRTEKRL